MDAGLDDDRVRDQMLTMLIAGHDTSTALLAWTFALLGRNPDIHSRLVQEIETMDKSPLLDQVIKESLRLYPPIHIGNRIVAEELDFEGNKIPSGERMFYSIYLTHRDPAVWENADQFCPERFSLRTQNSAIRIHSFRRRSALVYRIRIRSSRSEAGDYTFVKVLFLSSS